MTNTKQTNANQALKQVVDNLLEMYPDTKMYTRAEVNAAAGENIKGLMAFCATAKYGGHASVTKLSRGSYIIPKAWLTGEAPWDPTPSTEESVQKSEPKKVSNKKAAASTTSEEN
jgi:hypothetical protein